MNPVSTQLLNTLASLAVLRDEPEWVARFYDAAHLDIFHPQLWQTAAALAADSSKPELVAQVAAAQQQFEHRLQSLGWSLGAHQWNMPVGEVDQGDEGLFVEILLGNNGSPLRQGDKLFLHPYRYRSAEELLAAASTNDPASPFNFPEHSIAWHFLKRVEKYVGDELESGIEQTFEQWWANGGETLTEHEFGLQDLMGASWRGGVLKGQQTLAKTQAELEQALKRIERMEKALLSVRRTSEDTKSVTLASDALQEAALIPVNLLAVPKPRFRVFVQEMKESHRTTHWVTLENASRASDAKIWDNTGRITPVYHENPEYALESAQKWAEFLGVEVEQESGHGESK